MPDWEVVGRKKKEIQLVRKEKKLEELRFMNCTPKVTDLLHHSQIASLYSNVPKVAKSHVKSKPAAIKQNEAEKKTQKKKRTHTSNNEKSRSLETIIANIKYDELRSNCEISKARFDDNPLFQLKSLLGYLTSKLTVDQNKIVFTSKCFEHPLSLFPEKHRQLITHAVKQVDHATRLHFYESCLLAFTNDLNHGNPVSGYKVMLQVLVSNYPNLVFRNIDQTHELISSYVNPNKISVSTGILWVVAQAGNFSFQHGLEVWKTFMLPVIEQKNYTRFALDYLKHLFARCTKPNDSLGIPEYFGFLDLIFESYNIPKSVLNELQATCKLFRDRTLLVDVRSYFITVLKRIQMPYPYLHRQEMVSFLYSLLKHDPSGCFLQWQNVYVDYLPESVLLLRQIYRDWKKIELNDILLHKESKSALEGFYATNKAMYKMKQRYEGLDECNRIIETLLTKMTVKQSSPLRWLVLFTLMIFSAFIAYDVGLHGSFRKSQTAQTLKDLGILQQFDQITVYVQHKNAAAQKWFAKNGPSFLKQSADYIKPYLVLMKNLLIVFSNAVINGVITAVKYIAIKLPLLHEAIESCCPGITEWTKTFFTNAWHGFLYYAEYILRQSIVGLKFVLEYLRVICAQLIEYLQKNVFVGEYSPENLQKMAFHGLNVVNEYVSNSVTWISHKITDFSSQ